MNSKLEQTLIGLDASLVLNSSWSSNGKSGGVQQIIGQTYIPFAWHPDYGIINYCAPGSWIYIINLTSNSATFCNQINNNNLVVGLTANQGDNIIFFGILIPTN